jgi:hypothetical protein
MVLSSVSAEIEILCKSEVLRKSKLKRRSFILVAPSWVSLTLLT